ncbi:MAG: TIGR03435 family protein [Vicinamibacterales bacterium]
MIVKATLVSAGALTMARITRRSRASIRHLVLATAFIVLLALPLLSVAISPRHVSVPTSRQVAIAGLVIPPPPDATAWQAADNRGRLASSAIGSLLSPSMLAVVVWLTGVTLVLVPMGGGLIRVLRVRRSGVPWRPAQAVVDEIAAVQGVRAGIQLLLDEAVVGPMTCGVVRPAIILPRDAKAWNPEDLRRAIVHEVEHIRRGDWLMMCVARVVCALYWFHPLVWLAWRRLRLEAERACDDAVLHSAQPEAYADQLVTLAERLASKRTDSVLAMANRGDLSARVATLLDGRQARGPAGSLCIATAAIAAVLLSMAVAPLRAVAVPQSSQSAAPVKFDVASVRVNRSGTPGGFRGTKGRIFIATNQSLRRVIADAYGIPADRVLGGPGWIGTASVSFLLVGGERFDIMATLPDGAKVNQVPAMLRALLANRFKLVVHTEMRELPIYALATAREDGRLGPQLKKASIDCEAVEAAGEVIPPPAPGEPQRCAREVGGAIIGRGQTLSALARMLSLFSDRPVLDRTGLSGGFDFDVRFPELNTPPGGSGGPGPDGGGIFVAVQEQLGLKLQPARGSLEFIVIDNVERPTEN